MEEVKGKMEEGDGASASLSMANVKCVMT